MAYSEELAARIREVLGARAPFAEIKMFGGLCFTVNGNMALGVVGDELMARVGADAHDAALANPGARVMDFTDRPMKGFVFVEADAIKTKRALDAWTAMVLAYIEALPPKKAKAPKKKKPVARR